MTGSRYFVRSRVTAGIPVNPVRSCVCMNAVVADVMVKDANYTNKAYHANNDHKGTAAKIKRSRACCKHELMHTTMP